MVITHNHSGINFVVNNLLLMFFWDDCYGWFLAMKSSAYVYDHSFLYIVAVC